MALFSRVTEQYGELVNFIIRPPRDDSYTDTDLGPPVFPLGRKVFKRTDLELVNRRNQRLQCSHYEPTDPFRPQEKLPCVVYLHGNCSSRVEALGTLPILLPQDITVFAFDFSGSGKSEGNYVSLGWWEREDLDVVVEHLRSTGRVSTIGLWGRSMGAVTALLHADRDPSIGGMVLDSPFSSLRRLAEELAGVVVAWKLPRLVLNSLLAMVRTTIINKASFDINNLAPIDHVEHTFIPALFIVAKDDTFILPSHGEDLYAKYAGDRNILHVDGDHNSVRPRFLNDSAAIFFHTCLTVQALRAGQRADQNSVSSSLIGRRESSSFSRIPVAHVACKTICCLLQTRSAPGEADQRDASLDFGELPLLPGSTASSPSSLRSIRLRSRQTSTASVHNLRGDSRQRTDESSASARPSSSSSSSSCASSASSSTSPQAVRSSSLFGFPRSLWRAHSGGSQPAEGKQRKEGKPARSGALRVANAFRRRNNEEEQTPRAAEDGASRKASLLNLGFEGEGQGTRGVTERGARERRSESEPDGALREYNTDDFRELLTDDVSGDKSLGAACHNLYDMRRPEAAWGFVPGNSGGLQFLASEGYLDDEDEIVQRAVALSLEEYLSSQKSRQNSAEADGPARSISSSQSLPHVNEAPDTDRLELQGRTEAQQGKALEMPEGKLEDEGGQPWTSVPPRNASQTQGMKRKERLCALLEDAEQLREKGNEGGDAREQASDLCGGMWDRGGIEEDRLSDNRRLSRSPGASQVFRQSDQAVSPSGSPRPPLALPGSSGWPESVSSPSGAGALDPLSQTADRAPEARGRSRASLSRSSFSRPVFSFSFSKKKGRDKNADAAE
ncbi:Alpha/beta hydrolase, related [Neospora caninum Liverpool]|uniref:Alpha/beta hydrolase, related n=1 Tax=Neospora caninum (strain Liverpool) TaxID=572307 RepID=F0VJ54_NEOCL|nr:Alpha/beta hydrolase, related [Neospora caninum Liverpool]CBZ53765.1 Alpha/beta hydrolase, related [Neospora caninum Liverpool]|eukprot:XP_003883797.1 Alpha/beta hydrolase, related [Neospora caninum Liverpool]